MGAPDIRVTLEARGMPVTVRSMTPEDREREDAFVRSLSTESRYFRFHVALRQLTPDMLEAFTHPAYPDSVALIATVDRAEGEVEIAVARYARLPQSDTAEVAIVVADEWQGCGIGRRMLTELRALAREVGIQELTMQVLPDNYRMLYLARVLGFRPVPAQEHGSMVRSLGKRIQDGA